MKNSKISASLINVWNKKVFIFQLNVQPIIRCKPLFQTVSLQAL